MLDAIIAGATWIALIVLLWPSELSIPAVTRLLLGIFLFSAFGGPLYSLSILRPRLRWLFFGAVVAVAAAIVYALRLPETPVDRFWFVAVCVLASMLFRTAVGQRLVRQATQRLGESGGRSRRLERGFLGEYKIVGEAKIGGMGEVVPVQAADGQLYAAKTFRIFKQTDSSLLGIADISDWTGFLKRVFNSDAPAAAVIRQCLEMPAPDGSFFWADAAGPLDDVSKARLLEHLNAIIEGGSLIDRISNADLDKRLQTIHHNLKQQQNKSSPTYQAEVRQFGRLLFEATFGTTIKPSVQLRTNVRKELMEQFRKEAENWLELGEHPYLVRAHRVFQVDGRPYILLDYIAGGTLAEHLNKRRGGGAANRKTLPDLVRFALQICCGMSYVAQLHSDARFVHGDLKPDNCLLDAVGNIKITDLGLSRVVGGKMDDKPTEVMSGTVGYMAPELYKKQNPDVPSDIYAFGASLYRMLAGKTPASPSPNANVDVSFLEQITPDQAISGALTAILTRCLAYAPDNRYPDFAAIASDLRPIYEHLMSKRTIYERLTSKRITDQVCADITAATKEPAFLELANRGLSFLSLGLYAEADEYYRQALAIDPTDARAWNNRGEVQYRLGNMGAALKSFEAAIQQDPTLVAAWNGKGLVYEQRGDWDRAEECYREVLQRDPDRDEMNAALNNMGNLNGRRGKFEQAIECFDRVLETDPRSAETWGNKGTALSNLRRFDEAMKCWNRALDINPMLADVWYLKGTILRTQGKHAEALEALNQVLMLNPNDRQAKEDREAIKMSPEGNEADRHWYKGVEAERRGQFDKAVEEYKKAVKSNPQFAEAWFNIGSIHSKKKQYAEAIENYDRSIKAFDAAYPHDPASLRENASAFYNKAIALTALVKLDQAVLAYDEAIRRFPQHARALWNRGTVLDRLGRRREAADSLEKAVNLDPTAAGGLSERKARAYIQDLRDGR